jgi:hypothetical protein
VAPQGQTAGKEIFCVRSICDDLGGARCETFRAERRSTLSQLLAEYMLLVIGAVPPQWKVTTALSNGNSGR